MGQILRIYPTRLKAEDELARDLSEKTSGVLLSDSIVSFDQFEQRLVDDLAVKEPIGEIKRWLLIHEAVAGASGGNLQIAGLAETEGFIRSTGELLQQIKLGLVRKKELERIESFAPTKEKWLKKVFAGYEALLHRHGLLDSADVVAELIGKLAAAKEPPRSVAKFSEIHVHGVFHYTPARFELIRLLGRFRRVALHFPLPDERRRVFDFVERDIQKFQSLEDEAGGIEMAFEQSHGDDTVLQRFAASLFSENKPEPIEGLENHLEIVKNSGRYREIEEVAEKILKMKGDMEWSDFCLVFRDLEKYGQIVEDVFRRARIPIYLRRGIPLRSNPYVRTLLGIFDAIESDFERDEVARLASSQYFSFLPKGVEGHDVDRALVKAGITSGGPDRWNKRLKNANLDAKGRKAAAKIKKLLAGLEKLGKASRAGKCLAAFNSVIKMLGPKEIDGQQPYSLRDSYCKGRFEEVMHETQEALADTGMGQSPFSWRTLRRVMLNSLGNAHTPSWSGRNHVYALNVHELAGRRFHAVFICGLHDGEFPLSLQRGSILSESEKREFNRRHADIVLAEMPRHKRGRAVFSRLGESWEEESFIFYLAVRAAVSKLILSYSATDLAGRELLQSPFIEEIHDAFDKLPEEETKPVALEKDFDAQLDTAAMEAKLLGDLFTKTADEAGGLRGYYRHMAQCAAFRLSCEKTRMELGRISFYGEYDPVRRAAAASRFTGKLDGAHSPALATFFRDTVKRTFSPSALAQYAKCPFRYFMERVLGCGYTPVPTAEIERTTEGSVIHKALEYYYKTAGIKASPPLPPRPERWRLMQTAAQQAFKEFQAKGIEGEMRLWKITQEQILAALELFLDEEEKLFAEEPFEALKTELKFGVDREGKGKPLAITVDGETIFVTGTIDRVDHLPQSRMLRVIDYKYSASVTAHKKLLKPDTFCVESFQPPIYLFAALRLLGETKNAAGAYAAYISLKKEPAITKPEQSPFDTAGSAQALKKLEASGEFGGRILEIVKRMEGGDFSVTPKDCIFCPYLRACRYVEVRKAETDE